MKKNIGTKDRIARLLLGLALFIAAFFIAMFEVRVALIVLGIFSIYEALVGWCAFYMIIGRNTCPIE